MQETKTTPAKTEEISLKKIKQMCSVSHLDLVEIALTDGTKFHALLVTFDHENGTIKFIPH